MGAMTLPGLAGQYYTVFAGPFRHAPFDMVRVKMAAEINAPHEISIPTRDFSVPNQHHLIEGLREAVIAILSGQPVYVGCMGGIGRTGLFLAVLAKAWGCHDPIAYVRSTYYKHAVETLEQQRYINQIEIPADIRWMIKIGRVIGRFSFAKHLTNVPT